MDDDSYRDDWGGHPGGREGLQEDLVERSGEDWGDGHSLEATAKPAMAHEDPVTHDNGLSETLFADDCSTRPTCRLPALGSCRDGDTCHHRHSTLDPKGNERTLSTQRSAEDIYFEDSGPSLESTDDAQKAANDVQTDGDWEDWSTHPPCQFFTQGRCLFGDRCRNLHVLPTYKVQYYDDDTPLVALPTENQDTSTEILDASGDPRDDFSADPVIERPSAAPPLKDLLPHSAALGHSIVAQFEAQWKLRLQSGVVCGQGLPTESSSHHAYLEYTNGEQPGAESSGAPRSYDDWGTPCDDGAPNDAGDWGTAYDDGGSAAPNDAGDWGAEDDGGWGTPHGHGDWGPADPGQDAHPVDAVDVAYAQELPDGGAPVDYDAAWDVGRPEPEGDAAWGAPDPGPWDPPRPSAEEEACAWTGPAAGAEDKDAGWDVGPEPAEDTGAGWDASDVAPSIAQEPAVSTGWDVSDLGPWGAPEPAGPAEDKDAAWSSNDAGADNKDAAWVVDSPRRVGGSGGGGWVREADHPERGSLGMRRDLAPAREERGAASSWGRNGANGNTGWGNAHAGPSRRGDGGPGQGWSRDADETRDAVLHAVLEDLKPPQPPQPPPPRRTHPREHKTRAPVEHQGWDADNGSISSGPTSDNSSVQPSATSSRTSLSSAGQAPQRNGGSMGVCRAWQRGSCRFGSRCKFLHEDGAGVAHGAVSNSDASITDSPPVAPIPPPALVCFRWLRGRCERGYACEYQHKDLDYSRAPPKPAQRRTIDQDLRPPSPSGELTRTVMEFVKVTFGPGFSVKRVCIISQSCIVVLRNLPMFVAPEDVEEGVKRLGIVHRVWLKPDKSIFPHREPKQVAFVEFDTSTEAIHAVEALDKTNLFGNTIVAVITTKDNPMAALDDSKMSLSWPAPFREAFVGYSSRKEAEKRVATLDGKEWKDGIIAAAIHSGLPTLGHTTVRLELPPTAEPKDQKLFGKTEGKMARPPNYTSAANAEQGIHKALAFWKPTGMQIQPGPYKDHVVRAIVQFRTAADAKKAARSLNGVAQAFLGGASMRAFHMLYFEHVLPAMTFNLLRTDILKLQGATGADARMHISASDDPIDSPRKTYRIKLEATDEKNLGRLESQLRDMLRGDVARHDGQILWDDYFRTSSGSRFLGDLGRKHDKVLIQRDSLRRAIILFGSMDERPPVLDAIARQVEKLKKHTPHVLQIKGRIIGPFMSTELQALLDQFGSDNITFDLAARTLTILGDDQIVELARVALLKAEDSYPEQTERSDRVECPACFNEAASPVALGCGHAWCRTCLADYLTTAARAPQHFPLLCVGAAARCQAPIPLGAAQAVLAAGALEAGARAAFMAHVHARPDEFRFCPTPDCAHVYRAQAAEVQCPACLVRVCAACGAEAHEGVGCEEREEVRERLFREWREAHDVKACPRCRVTIERAAGCNHMTCTQCKVHICWVCSELFEPPGLGIYEHMQRKHGGIGL